MMIAAHWVVLDPSLSSIGEDEVDINFFVFALSGFVVIIFLARPGSCELPWTKVGQMHATSLVPAVHPLSPVFRHCDNNRTE